MRTAAAAIVIVSLLTACGSAPSASEPAQHAHTRPDPVLNVGAWAPGDVSMLARGGGRVSVDDAGCIHLRVGRGTELDVVWPAGYSADAIAGRAVIRNAKGEVVLRQGDDVVVGGGFAPSDDLRCQVSKAGDAFYVQQRLRPRTGAA